MLSITGGMPVHTAWDIVIDPTNPQIIYIATEHTVYKTTDGGAIWTRKGEGITNRFIFTLAMDPTDPNVLYAGTIWGIESYIYKSTNGGENWIVSKVFDEPYFINSIVVNPVDPQTVYAGTDACVFKSTDQGLNWNSSCGICPLCITNSYIRDLTIDPTNHTILYAATWGGLFKSLDAGNTWAIISEDFNNPFVKTVILDPSNSQTIYAGVFGGVYKSLDAGESWILYIEGLYRGAMIAQSNIAIDPRNSDNLFVGTYGGGVFKSIDGGCTWNGINCGIPIAWTNNGLTATYASDTLILYVGLDGGGVYKSTDGGMSWVHKNEGLPVREVLNLKIDPYDHEILYLATGKGAFKTVNGAENWYPINEGLTCLNIKDFAIDLANPQVVYAATDGGGVFKSNDGGNLWSNCSIGILNPRTFRLAIDPVNTQTVYVGTILNGFFKSTDGGKTWFESNNGLKLEGGGAWDNAVSCIFVDTSNPNIIHIGIRRGGIYKSVNGGETWIPWNNGLTNRVINALVLDPQDLSIVYAGTGGGLFRWTPSKAIVTSTDQNGNEKNEYYPEEDVWVKATGLSPDTNYKIWIQLNPVNEGDTLDPDEDPSGTQETVTTDGNGNFENKQIWSIIPSEPLVEYDIVVDKQGTGEGTYNVVDDGLDSVSCFGFKAPIPEFTTIAIPVAAIFGLVFLFSHRRRKE